MSEGQPSEDAGRPAPAGTEAGTTCGSCGAQAPAGTRRCPQCGHKLYRTCFCGLELLATEATCPQCGADWSQSMRVSRRTRTRHARTGEAVRYALIGAGSTAAALVLAYLLMTVLALAAPDPEGGLNGGVAHRLTLAVEGASYLLSSIGQAVARHAPVVLGGLAVVLLGAAGGLVTYLVELRRGHRHSSTGRRRLHRKRRR